MRALLDQNLSPKLRGHLSGFFEEVVHTEDVGLAKADDLLIWEFAGENGYVVLTKDGDFAILALLNGPPPQVVRLRIGNGRWRRPAEILAENAALVRAF